MGPLRQTRRNPAIRRIGRSQPACHSRLQHVRWLLIRRKPSRQTQNRRRRFPTRRALRRSASVPDGCGRARRRPAVRRLHGDEDLAIRSGGRQVAWAIHLWRRLGDVHRAVPIDSGSGRQQDRCDARDALNVEPAIRSPNRKVGRTLRALLVRGSRADGQHRGVGGISQIDRCRSNRIRNRRHALGIPPDV